MSQVSLISVELEESKDNSDQKMLKLEQMKDDP